MGSNSHHGFDLAGPWGHNENYYQMRILLDKLLLSTHFITLISSGPIAQLEEPPAHNR